MGIADTGTTGHFLAINNPHLLNVQPATQPIRVRLPDNSFMTSTHTAELDLPCLPTTARQAHLFPAMEGTSLISIAKMCDSGCEALFQSNKITIFRDKLPILEGHRCPNTNLWMLPLSAPEQANASITLPSKAPDLVKHSHATLFSPALSALHKALNNAQELTKFPGLTTNNLKRHPPTQSVAMHKGHLDQTRANQQSTKAKPQSYKEALLHNSTPDEDDTPMPLPHGLKTHSCYAKVIHFEPRAQTHSDQTGKFPTTSAQGNKYVFVLYDYDSNSIMARPLKSREAQQILEAFQSCYNVLRRAGLKPKLHRLDNECSAILKEFMQTEEIDCQLVPPGIHRRNAAERAIRTFKNHLIAGLSSTHPDFPIAQWDRLLEQAEITLNLLRTSRMNPKLSAYAQVHGPFDYNRTPMAPPGTKVLIHDKPNNRGTWAPHGTEGWYIGPAMEHYRCFKTYVPSTKAERTTDTVAWFPHNTKMPTASSLDLTAAATKDTLSALQKPTANSPLHPLSDSETEALKTAVNILNKRTETLPVPPPPKIQQNKPPASNVTTPSSTSLET